MKTMRIRSLLTVFGFVVVCFAVLSAIGDRGPLPGGATGAQIVNVPPPFIFETWVSGTGTDNAGCSRTVPCKTLARAIAITQPGGVVSVVDPGNFHLILDTERIVIDKPITIDGGGVKGLVIAPPTLTTVFFITSRARVILKNLSIHHFGDPGVPGTEGIRVAGTPGVMIENVSIIGFNKGIFMTGGELFIDDSSIHDNSTGIECNTGRISIENVRIQNNNVGLQLNGTANAPAPAATTMSRSLISGSRDFGAVVINNSRLAMQDCMVTNNQVGIDLRAVSSALKAFVQARSGRSR